VVYDEVGSSGAARLLALYQSRDAAAVGPVDDTRPGDLRVLAVTEGLLAHGGGTRGVIMELDRSAVADLGRPGHPSGYATRTGCAAPYNVFAATRLLYAEAAGERHAPPALFSYGGPGRPAPQGTPRSRITVRMPGQPSQAWEYSPRTRIWHMASGPVPGLAVTNVVVQTVTYKPERIDKRHSINVAVVDGEGRQRWPLDASSVVARGASRDRRNSRTT